MSDRDRIEAAFEKSLESVVRWQRDHDAKEVVKAESRGQRNAEFEALKKEVENAKGSRKTLHKGLEALEKIDDARSNGNGSSKLKTGGLITALIIALEIIKWVLMGS